MRNFSGGVIIIHARKTRRSFRHFRTGRRQCPAAVADTFADGVASIGIAGQVPHTPLGTQAFREIDAYHVGATMTKAVLRPERVEPPGDTQGEDFAIARFGRPVPVLSEVPKNIQIARDGSERIPSSR